MNKLMCQEITYLTFKRKPQQNKDFEFMLSHAQLYMNKNRWVFFLAKDGTSDPRVKTR